MPSNTAIQPAFMIEMSEHLRHIIMKRNYLLRSAKSKSIQFKEQIASRSWLEVVLAEKPRASVLAWDQARYLAEKFKAELRADVFVEPAYEAGRYHRLTAPVNPTSADFGSGESNGLFQGSNAFDFNPLTAMGLSGGGRQGQHSGSQFGMAGGHGLSGLPGINGLPNIPGMPNIGGLQSPTDFLPAHVREALSFGEKSNEIVLPALRELPAFSELPEATRDMFEVEAVQLLQGLVADVGVGEHTEQSLVALVTLPTASRRLRQFLSNALAVAA